MSSLRKHTETQLTGTNWGEIADNFFGVNDYLGGTEFQFHENACRCADCRRYKKMQFGMFSWSCFLYSSS